MITNLSICEKQKKNYGFEHQNVPTIIESPIYIRKFQWIFFFLSNRLLLHFNRFFSLSKIILLDYSGHFTKRLCMHIFLSTLLNLQWHCILKTWTLIKTIAAITASTLLGRFFFPHSSCSAFVRYWWWARKPVLLSPFHSKMFNGVKLRTLCQLVKFFIIIIKPYLL